MKNFLIAGLILFIVWQVLPDYTERYNNHIQGITGGGLARNAQVEAYALIEASAGVDSTALDNGVTITTLYGTYWVACSEYGLTADDVEQFDTCARLTVTELTL